MGKIKQKGKSGAARVYITRNQALKKLQVTLADFRRICILKGVYPREPKNKKKANKGSTAPVTFYYTKDIQYLLHEPIVQKFREYKTFVRKLSKAIGKGELDTAKRLENNKPVYHLDHIIKERYPTFHDAIKDIDDALSMLFLFSTMPVTDKIGAATVANCERLCAEFQQYVIRNHSLRKTFLSIKGIYYQADIFGVDVTWIVPYKFSQNVPTDVDFRIMHTFLEFYQSLMGFVNFKLFSSAGLRYPPKLDVAKIESAAGLAAYDLEESNSLPAIAHGDNKEARKRIASLGHKIGDIVENDSKTDERPEQEVAETSGTTVENGEDEKLDEFKSIDEDTSDAASKVNTQVSSVNTSLLSPFTFYLSREVPRFSLEFVIRAFGGKVAWDPVLGAGSPYAESDPVITHHISDRPHLAQKYEGRVYIQPQWVYDSVNKGHLERTDLYVPGATLPPHLSPFVKVSENDYNPEDEVSAGEEEEEEDVEANEDKKAIEAPEKERVEEPTADVEEDETEKAELEHQRELEAEAAGVEYSEYIKNSKPSKSKKRSRDTMNADQKDEKEAKELSKMMMSNKQRKLYNKLENANVKKENYNNSLRNKKKNIEKNKKAKADK
ncbi:pescadillo-family BRCT domain-containing protein [Schizosaccharomyces cryophilus OY26]|uniref:Pescadillo homolog n=1 Tax=Schizosaccharomyces cryophilus (strain OY26 / ATCC MYA-4695 / CBS 11777 / NBRC 106824 / NRRL Y48691) TaxID=653667 RepID=S9XJ92_SCHCR|nr:pescadillo-family BRCT domain-containing protein [Schizosaccharomyces cryophilus OY26]EPY53696.1 pescadillo-family BRCT domain-containing protein [Schizosaccharomyces cryophilus OY26]